MSQRRPDVLLNAPVVPLRYTVDDGDEPWTLYACDRCLPWSADIEVVEGQAVITEWHAHECLAVAEWIEGATDGA